MTYPSREQAQPLLNFILKRHSVYLARKAGAQKPWTDDQILQRYRFCNVYRELDAVTVWIRKNYGKRYGWEKDLWFSTVVARLINRSGSLNELKPLPWDPDKFVAGVHNIKATQGTAFGAAYIVSTNGVSMDKARYLADRVLTPMWEARARLRPYAGQRLSQYHALLGQFQGMGSFMAAQVVADLKNEQHCPLKHAPDWGNWASPGPGSMRGLNRVLGNGGVKTGYKTGTWLAGVNMLQFHINPLLRRKGWQELCAHDMQNCLCEFDKYERVRLGEGEPKQRYPGEQGELI